MQNLRAVRAFVEDAAILQELQQKWGLPSQQLAIKNLIKLAQEVKELKDRLLDVEAQLEQLKDVMVERTGE